ncbi:probable basic-leucine zipper transcription factor Q isoform X2 [Prorops nasuta]|uniref:probable basic-leucine zipper transcription factor Q isoform X2 n=1 Tax=Prorops nasuta TaxID=863751 RepID=UPI0034CD53B3
MENKEYEKQLKTHEINKASDETHIKQLINNNKELKGNINKYLMEKALLYMEQKAINLANEPSKCKRPFVNAVYVLGDRIRYHDPVCKDAIEDVANLAWLNNLAEIVDKCQTGEIIEEEAFEQQNVSTNQDYGNKQQAQQQQQQWNIPQQEYREEPISMMEVPSTNMQYARNEETTTQFQQTHQDYWGKQWYYQATYWNNTNWQQQSMQPQVEQSDIDGSQQQQETWNFEEMVS